MLIIINHYFRDPVIKQPGINGKSQGFLFVAQMVLPIGSAGWEFPQMAVSFVMGLVKEYPTLNPLKKSGLGIIVICPDLYI